MVDSYSIKIRIIALFISILFLWQDVLCAAPQILKVGTCLRQNQMLEAKRQTNDRDDDQHKVKHGYHEDVLSYSPTIVSNPAKEIYLRYLQESHQLIGPGTVEFPRLYKEIKTAVDRLLKAAGFNPDEFEFYLVDHDNPNAFVFRQDNKLFCNLGLIHVIVSYGGSLDAITAILAHEVMHLIKEAEKGEAKKETEETAEQQEESFIWSAISDYVGEYTADWDAISLLESAGYSVSEAATPFKAMKKKQSTALSFTHPQTKNRINHVEDIVLGRYWLSYFNEKAELSQQAKEELFAPSRHRRFQQEVFECNTPGMLQGVLEKANSMAELEFAMIVAGHSLPGPDLPWAAFENKARELAGNDAAKLALYNFQKEAIKRYLGLESDVPEFEKISVEDPRYKQREHRFYYGEEALSLIAGGFSKEVACGILQASLPVPISFLSSYPSARDGKAINYGEEWAIYERYRTFLIGGEERGIKEGDGWTVSHSYGGCLNAFRFSCIKRLSGYIQSGIPLNEAKDIISKFDYRRGEQSFMWQPPRPPNPLPPVPYVGNGFFAPAALCRAYEALTKLIVGYYRNKRPMDYEETKEALDYLFESKSLMEIAEYSPLTTHTAAQPEESLKKEIVQLIMKINEDAPDVLKELLAEREEMFDDVLFEEELKAFASEKAGPGIFLGRSREQDLNAIVRAYLIYHIKLDRADFQSFLSHYSISPDEAIFAFENGLSQIQDISIHTRSRLFSDLAWLMGVGVSSEIKMFIQSRLSDLGILEKYPELNEASELVRRIVYLIEIGAAPHERNIDRLISMLDKNLSKLSALDLETLVKYLKDKREAISSYGGIVSSTLQPLTNVNLFHESYSWDDLIQHIGVAALQLFRGIDKTNVSMVTQELEGGLDSPLFPFVGEISTPIRTSHMRVEGLSLERLEFISNYEASVEKKPRRNITRPGLHHNGAQLIIEHFDYLLNSEASASGDDMINKAYQLLPPTAYRNLALYTVWMKKIFEPAIDEELAPEQIFDSEYLKRRFQSLENSQRKPLVNSLKRILPYFVKDTKIESLNLGIMFQFSGEKDESIVTQCDRERPGYQDIRFFVPGGILAQLDLALVDIADIELRQAMPEVGFYLEERLNLLFEFLPRPSPYRDRYLWGMVEERHLSVSDIYKIRESLSSEYLREQCRLIALNKEKEEAGQENIADELRRLQRYYPERSPIKDDILMDVFERCQTDEEQEQVKSLLISSARDLRKKETAQYIVGGDIADRVIEQLDPEQKAEFLLWLLDLRPAKPLSLVTFEYRYQINLDPIKDEFKRSVCPSYPSAGKSSNNRLLNACLHGKKGIFNNIDASNSLTNALLERLLADPQAIRVVLEACGLIGIKTGQVLVGSSIPKLVDAMQETGLKDKILRYIFESIFQEASERRKEYIVFNLVDRIKRAAALPVGAVEQAQALSMQEALAGLVDEAAPMSKGLAFDILRLLSSELEAKGVKVIRFGERLGSASIKGAIYEAWLEDGRRVVIKFKRPEIDKIIEEDLEFLDRIIRSVFEKLKQEGASLSSEAESMLYRLVKRLNEFLKHELDFDMEVDLQNRISHNIAVRGGNVHIPQIIATAGNMVIVEERVEGLCMRDESAIENAGFDIKEIKSRLAREFLTQLLIDGVAHIDPNRGNVGVNRENRKPYLVDFGAAVELGPQETTQAVNLIQAVSERKVRNAQNAIKELFVLAGCPERFNKQLRDDVSIIVKSQDDVILKVILLQEKIERLGVELPSTVALFRMLSTGGYLFEGISSRDRVGLFLDVVKSRLYSETASARSIGNPDPELLDKAAVIVSTEDKESTNRIAQLRDDLIRVKKFPLENIIEIVLKEAEIKTILGKGGESALNEYLLKRVEKETNGKIFFLVNNVSTAYLEMLHGLLTNISMNGVVAKFYEALDQNKWQNEFRQNL